MAQDSKKPDSVIQNLGLEIHEAQLVLTSKGDITGVFGWLSKEGTLYFTGGLMGANDVEKELEKAGYHVVERFNN